jgi:hypothetical protein
MYSRSFKDNAAWNNLWQYIPTIFAYNTIVPFHYCGGIGGELLVYDATKLYVGYFLELSSLLPAAGGVPACSLYNQANVLMFNTNNCSPVWNTTVAVVQYMGRALTISTLWFSRIEVNIINYMRFNGYRLTIV